MSKKKKSTNKAIEAYKQRKAKEKKQKTRSHPLITEARDAITSEEGLITALISSSKLIDEPEFAEPILSPIVVLDTFSLIGVEKNISPEKFESMDEQTNQETHEMFLSETIERLFDNTTREHFVDRLNLLRQRFTREGKQDALTIASTVQLLLENSIGKEIWSSIGLVRAEFQRSLRQALAVFQDIDKVISSNDDITIVDYLKQLENSDSLNDFIKVASNIDEKIMGDMDDLWVKGQSALFDGDICLNLYTDDELFHIDKLFFNILQEANIGNGSEEPTISPEDMKLALTQLKEHVDKEVLMPMPLERFQAIQTQVATITHQQKLSNKWGTFFVVYNNAIQAEDAYEDRFDLLGPALFGEFKVALFKQYKDAQKTPAEA